MAYKISGTKSETARIMIIKESDWSIESNTVISGSGAYEVDGLAAGAKTVVAEPNESETLGFGGVTPIAPAFVFQDLLTDDTWWTEIDADAVGAFTPGGYVKSISTPTNAAILYSYPDKWTIGAGDWEVIVDFDLDSITGAPTNLTRFRFKLEEYDGGKYASYCALELQGNSEGGFYYRNTGEGLPTDDVGILTTGNFKFRMKNVSGTVTVWIWSGSQWEWDGNPAGRTSTETGAFDLDIDVTLSMSDTDASNWAAWTINSVTLVSGTFVDLT